MQKLSGKTCGDVTLRTTPTMSKEEVLFPSHVSHSLPSKINSTRCVWFFSDFNCTLHFFSGEMCEQDFNECESNPCLNNATCVDGTNGYICYCAAGYMGTHCEIDIAVCNVTNETRCANGGTCVEGPGITFTCRCEPGRQSHSLTIRDDEVLWVL